MSVPNEAEETRLSANARYAQVFWRSASTTRGGRAAARIRMIEYGTNESAQNTRLHYLTVISRGGTPVAIPDDGQLQQDGRGRQHG